MSLDVHLMETSPHCVFDSNITHNLAKMAEAAGIYQACWRPEDIRITTARELIPHLELGLERLRFDPKRFEALAPENGWGTYQGLVHFVVEYLSACREHPDAAIEVSR